MLINKEQYIGEYSVADQVLTSDDYKDSLTVQNASNLSGVVFSFAEVMKKICEESSFQKQGTIWKNQHPICVLYLCAIANLTTQDLIDAEQYSVAYEICKQKAE